MQPPADPESAAAQALPLHLDAQFRRLWSLGLVGWLVRWVEMLAYGVFTYQQTQSAFWVASMTLLRLVPFALFGVPFGALAAHISRRTGLFLSLGTLLVTTLALLAASVAGALQVWHLGLASFINGVAWSGDNALRRSLIGDIAGPQRMARAMAFDNVASAACRLAGPGIGGLLLAGGGTTVVFIFTATLYVAGLAAAAGIADPRVAPGEARPGTWARLAGGFQAARESPRLAAVLWITVLFNLFGWPVLSMVPVIGQEHLQLSTQAIGLLASMDGVGGLLGSLVLSSLARRRSGHGHLYVGGLFLFLAALPVFALSVHPTLTGAALLVAGFGQSGISVMQTTLVYMTAPPHRRLEAMGLLTMCIGIAPIGFLGVGWLAEAFGAPVAAVVSAASGLGCLALTWPVWRACVREAPGVH